MQKKIIAANWKMHKTRSEAREFIQVLSRELRKIPKYSNYVELLIFPPFTALEATHRAILDENIQSCNLGAQNIHPETYGAYTGEISAVMIKDVGASTVLVGHSERRILFGEKDDFLLQKVRRCIYENLTPLLCLGETLQERDDGITKEVLHRQVENIFSQLSASEACRVRLAYEPVWAIGTGRNASPQQAAEAHQWIRERLYDIHPDIASKIPILYGGSVKPENAKELLSQPHIDGALIGGASLQPDTFFSILLAAIDNES